MKQGFEMKIEQSQRLALTPSLLQAINVLQLNTLQLESYVQEQLLSNPMLEMDESAPAEERREVSRDEEIEKARAERKRKDDERGIDWASYAEYTRESNYEPVAADEDPDEYTREPASPAGTTLADSLALQLQLSGLRRDILPLSLYVAGCLDSDGYLRVTLAEIGEQTGASLAEVKEALLHVQAMEPAGVGARSLTECLSLQLIRKGLDTPLAMLLVKECLEDIAKGRVASLARQIGVNPQDVQDACDLIRTLNPKPGSLLGLAGDAHYIVPDVYVERSEDGFAISVREGATPRLIISPYYRKLLTDPQGDAYLKEFLEGRYNSAAWLIRSIAQRTQTILSVTRAIVDLQEGFFEGNAGLAPMTLSQAASLAGVHESTVSRCVNGKYVQTPRGLFELRSFFNGGLSAGSGELSTDSIKKLIRAYIEAEDCSRPLSDQAIAEKLHGEKSVEISRRTVAKYREAMNIPGSAARKRF